MTIATEIISITDFTDDNSDVTNAVTEATSMCAMHDVTDNEIIKSAAMEILYDQRRQRQGEPIKGRDAIHKMIERLKGKDVDTTTVILHEYKSPRELDLDPFSWD